MVEHRPITCEEVVAHLLTYLDGELDADMQARIQDHLEQCRGCYSRAEFEQALHRRLQELDREPPPPALARRIKKLLARF